MDWEARDSARIIMTTLNTSSRSSTPSTQSSTLEASVVRVVRTMRMRGVVRASGCIIGAVSIAVFLDWALHLSASLRWAFLAGILWISIWASRRLIRDVFRIRIRPSDLALNIADDSPTHSNTNRQSSALAAIADLPKAEGNLIEQQLIRSISTRSTSHLDTKIYATIRSNTTREMIAIFAGFLVLCLTAFASPTLLTIGARRVVMPWTHADWPKQFGIEVLVSAIHHPSDRAFIARANIGPSKEHADAKLRWRLVDNAGTPIVRWTSLVLNRQKDPSRYEQLIPIHTLSAQSIPAGSTLEYRIETRDDRSDVQSIQIVHPPKLQGVEIETTLPDYAQSIHDSAIPFLQGNTKLSPSSLSIGPILAGSTITTSWTFDTEVHAKGTERSESNTITNTQRINDSGTITTVPIDKFGFSPRAAMDVFVRVVPDAPPEAIVQSPSTDLTVGQRAIIELSGYVTDDLGLAAVSMNATIQSGSNPTDHVLLSSVSDGLRERTLPAQLNLAEYSVNPGSQVELSVSAIDLLGQETRSVPRVIRVVEDREILERVESQLGSIGEVLRRLDSRQRELRELTSEGSDVLPDDQSSLTTQIDARSQATSRLLDMLEQSNIQDPQLTPMLEGINNILSEAREQSQRATDALERSQKEQATERMDRVRDQLGNAIAMLDRGQDTWLARRSIEDLRSKVQELLDETNELGQQTAGKSIDQLSEDQRSMLQRILDKQRRATNQARETIDALDKQADALEENNPTGAQGIRDAATQGRNSGIEEQLAQSGDELAENQTSSAAATQQQVLEELDNMIEQIEQAQKNRDSALRRKLASIIESIQGLLEDHELELGRLDEGFPNLDRPMIAIRENTLAVRDDAASAFPETQSIAESMTKAADSQSIAITALRADPQNLTSARQSELSAMAHLQSALDEAERQDEQAADRQAQQLREELRAKYQDALELQSQISLETPPLVGQRLNRRQRAAARELSERENSLNETLKTMVEETEELSEAPIFSLAHDQLEDLLDSTSSALSEQTIDPMVTNDQQAIATILSALIDVLGNQSQPQSDEFEDGQGGDGGGQGGGGQEPVIPPIAQLQLLRTLQQLTATQTRSLAEQDAPDLSRVRKNGQMQRELAEKGQRLIEEMNPAPPSDEQPVKEPVAEPGEDPTP
tara:strand:+ start:151528 stop:155001 length:3474 start_codon:yes stop_codon:yes gene_type:complete